MTTTQYRPLQFGVTRATLRDGAPGVHYLRAEQALPAYPDRMTDRLVHWARERPEQTLFARREKHADGSSGDWRHISFAQALDAARRIGQRRAAGLSAGACADMRLGAALQTRAVGVTPALAAGSGGCPAPAAAGAQAANAPPPAWAQTPDSSSAG